MKIETIWKALGATLLVGAAAPLTALLAQQPAQAPTPAPGPPAGRGGRGAQAAVWAPKPITPGGWIAPNKPIWRLADILAAHKGQASWTEPIVRDQLFQADYISMAPGEKTLPCFVADTREWWIVQDGQIRFTIEGQEPFVAGKGYMVEVPYRNLYSMETVGDKPSLRFEVNIANATREYPADEQPPSMPGFEFVKITVAGKGKYDNTNHPFFDFNDVVSGKVRSDNFIKDDRAVVNIIRQRGSMNEGSADNGHFHESSTEFWFIMEGHVRYAIETQPAFVAEQGDVVYAPIKMRHLASSYGEGMSTRIAMNGYVDLGHHYPVREATRK